LGDNSNAGHRKRLRERYRSQGLNAFSEHEVLEFILFHCYARCDTKKIAKRMLEKFGSLHNLMEADVQTLMDTLKCTENVAVLLNFIPSVANRYFRDKWGERVILDDVEITGKYAIDLFVGETVEKFYVICLDKKFKLINTVLISEGTLDESAVYLREIVGAAIKNHAISIILTHNHPGGSFNPSRSDLAVTEEVYKFTKTMGVSVLDHVIVSGDTYYSFSGHNDKRVKGYF